MKNIKIIHLLHADGPGGIEVGAKLGEQELKKYINYEIKYIFNSEDKVITRLVKWFSNPQNQDKIKNIVRFLKDWWPTMLAAYLLFGNSFVLILIFPPVKFPG